MQKNIRSNFDMLEPYEPQLWRLRTQAAQYRAQHEEVAGALQSAHTQLSALSEERAIWEQIATESDQAKAAMAEQLARLQTQALAAAPGTISKLFAAASQAASLLELDEAATRCIIDQQLRQAGCSAEVRRRRLCCRALLQPPPTAQGLGRGRSPLSSPRKATRQSPDCAPSVAVHPGCSEGLQSQLQGSPCRSSFC